ncbi:MAG: DNA-directed RNA polymerase subunit alpha C-terminal domain-containing protein [Polyangiales bacterium]
MTTRSLFPGVQRLEDIVKNLKVLDVPVDLLDLPARMRYWAADHQVETVLDLLHHSPQSLQREPHLGPKSIEDTRAELERKLGCTWEAAAVLLTTPAVTPVPVSDAAFQQRLDALRATPVERLELPVRMRRFIRKVGVSTLGDLWDVPRERMESMPNLGRKSIDDTFDIVRAWVMTAELPRGAVQVQGVVTADTPSFLGAWTRLLGGLPPIDRLVLQHRTGMLGSVEGFEVIAAMLGVSEERVRQIESRALGALTTAPDVPEVLARVREAVPGAVRRLATLADDPWWDGVIRGHVALDLFLERIATTTLRVVELGEHRLLTTLPAPIWNDLWVQWCAMLENHPWPTSSRALRERLDGLCMDEGEGVADALWTRTLERLHQDDGPDGAPRALAWGDDDDAEVLALLRAATAPMAVSAVHASVGHAVKLPKEVLWFDHGMVGVPQHVPEFDTWSAAVVPAAVSVMQREPAGTVWLVSEVHDALAQQRMVPPWMNAWLLGSMLQRHPSIRSHGRSKVALAEPRRTQRPSRL